MPITEEQKKANRIQPMRVNQRAGIPTVRFTPEFYKTVYRQLRGGDWTSVIEMMIRAETDAHVAGCLEGRRAGIVQEFMVKPYEDGNATDQERAEWWDARLRRLKPYDLFEAIQEGRLRKFKVIDFEWEVLDGKLTPVACVPFEQKYFRYDLRGDKRLKIDHGRALEEIPPTALVCETNKLPKMFPVLKEYILKEFGVESWAAFLETFGEPFILGLYPHGADTAVKGEIDDAVEALARSARGTMPDTGLQEPIKIIETQRTTGDHSVFDERCDRKISIALLGHANAVEQSKGMQVGENLTQYKVKREVAMGDLRFIDEHIERLTKIVFDLNFGDGRYPVFATDKKPPLDQKQHRDNILTVFEMGGAIYPEDIARLGVKVEPDAEPLVKTDPFSTGLP